AVAEDSRHTEEHPTEDHPPTGLGLCDGPDKEAISSLISRMGLNKHIQLLGNVHNMSRFYHSIDLLITPSIKEPFGLTIAEAMAHGIPVICTEVDGTTEVFVNGTSGLAIKPTLTATEYQALGGNLKGWPEYIYSPTEDTIVEAKALAPDLLAKEISMLLNNKHRYSAMSLQARDHAVNQLNYQKHVEKLYRLLLA
ncbi:MAG: glycosyltransferase family 4 protein, partial [Spongiibacteraceae bacterium]|nr:glycosyltransferase family 4 protein [Spongiibacteraceae bacterium]